ncbi:hypothetical protein [Bordetella trematum]|uniref:hypothetical protein n=1 Tax=Bordetella trematum TaxID=123899 RepID=UPI0015C569E5|nr:hypothetical protein [Bordetella trematum]
MRVSCLSLLSAPAAAGAPIPPAPPDHPGVPPLDGDAGGRSPRHRPPFPPPGDAFPAEDKQANPPALASLDRVPALAPGREPSGTDLRGRDFRTDGGFAALPMTRARSGQWSLARTRWGLGMQVAATRALQLNLIYQGEWSRDWATHSMAATMRYLF